MTAALAARPPAQPCQPPSSDNLPSPPTPLQELLSFTTALTPSDTGAAHAASARPHGPAPEVAAALAAWGDASEAGCAAPPLFSPRALLPYGGGWGLEGEAEGGPLRAYGSPYGLPPRDHRELHEDDTCGAADAGRSAQGWGCAGAAELWVASSGGAADGEGRGGQAAEWPGSGSPPDRGVALAAAAALCGGEGAGAPPSPVRCLVAALECAAEGAAEGAESRELLSAPPLLPSGALPLSGGQRV